MQMRRAVKCLVALACSLVALGMALGQTISPSVNYRGQPQEDLTCMQASSMLASGDVVVYRNDPSTNCFGFPSLQFDTAPVEGGKPNGMTIDWSLMVDELQMQDDDRVHFHLPGFTGGHNTFGIMGSAIDTAVDGNGFTPNFESEAIAGDLSSNDAVRADFGALVGIWGISCGTEKNLYMDRAKVDNLRTAEWDPAREMLKFVLKARRYGGVSGRHDGYTGTRSIEFASAQGQARWTSVASSGLPVPPTVFATDPQVDGSIGNVAKTDAADITVNDQSLRGSHLQAMEYAFEGPRASILGADLSTLSQDDGILGSKAALTNMNYKNDGYIYAPGNRVCGIYVDPSKLHRGQLAASGITNGIGPLPPYGGIGKNWYKLAYMRRFAATQCSGGTQAGTRLTRPGMLPESCMILKTSQNLALFWQVPFDGDTERVVGYQFTTNKEQHPAVGVGSKPAGYVQAPTFSFAQAKGRTTGMGNGNCITVSLIPSVTIMSGSAKSEITIEGLMNSGSSDSDTLPLFSNDKCTMALTALAGSNGASSRSFQPVKGTSNSGLGVPETPAAFSATGPVAATASATNILANYRPFGRAALRADGRTRVRTTTTLASALEANTGGYGSNGFLDDVDWHTRARTGTTSALTTGNPNNNVLTASTLQAAQPLASGQIVSPIGSIAVGNGLAKFSKADGKLTVAVAPGYYLKAGELLVFSFMLENNAVIEQASQALAVSASGTYCDSGDQFCDGVSDPSLGIKSVPVSSKGMILETKKPMFVTSTVYQASSDPDDLTTIFVTLRTNMDLKRPDATSKAEVTISGLAGCGFETGTNVQLYQNQKAGGLPKDSVYPTEAVQSQNDLPGKTSGFSSIIDAAAKYSSGVMTITLGEVGLVAEQDYAFAFQLQTTKVANTLCSPKISSTGGSQVIAVQDMSTTTLGVVRAPQFTTLKIGQVTTRPGVTNYLCVTLQHNYQFYSDAVVNQGQGATGNYVESKITISGLTGTQAVSSALQALAYCPTSVAYFDDKTTQHTSTQFQPDVTDFAYQRYATNAPGSNCFGTSAADQKCIPGNPYVPSTAFDTTVAGRSWFGSAAPNTKDTFAWDQATGTATLTVDAAITKERVTEPQTVQGGIPKNSEIVFALPLQNGFASSECKTVTFESSGKIVQKATMVQTRTGKAIQDGETPGDACALKVYEPGFLVRRITQSTSSTGDDNVITVSLRSNVDLSSVANGQASYITISGLTGSATGNADLNIGAPAWKFSPRFEKGTGAWNQATGSMVLKIDSGLCRPPTVWASGTFGSQAVVAPFAKGGSAAAGTTAYSTCIKAGFTYSFSFILVNPDAEQAAPSVSIEGKFRNSDNLEVSIAKKAVQGPISDSPEQAAMLVSNQILTTYKIGQLVPAPGSQNIICVTIVSSKDIKSLADGKVSSITFSGLTGFETTAQDLQMYYSDGVTRITSAGGDPSKGDSYRVGKIFSARNSASGTTATTSGSFAGSGLGFANYDGAAAGNVVVWIQGETITSDGAYQYMQRDVEHKFCFRLNNPKTETACKDVSVIVDNKGTISRIKAEQDLRNTIEYYKFGSTCAGYVAPPNFIIKNWRSSSNTTSATAIIHLELASNIKLGTGDTITVTGLTSYTRQCGTPPCDVGIDVTRTAVSHLHNKMYVNGMRSVRGFGLSDSSATVAERVSFANAIQSYDTSGTLDGARTSTFGADASWGKLGDTQESASTLTFTVAKDAEMRTADIANTIGTLTAPSHAVLYEIVFALQNKATAVAVAPTISINIGQGQTQYMSVPVSHGQAMSVSNGVKACGGGLEITFTPMKTIYGGESLILTLPKFTRDSNGMLYGVASSPNTAFSTYANWHDWKAYGTSQKYARAFFTNGFVADGYHAKSGDAGQTGERWNYPNVNAKATTDADYNHDTGVLVLDMNDPGIGMNKDYWYAATEDNLYEGRVTRAANDGAAASPNVDNSRTPYTSSTTVPMTYAGVAASVDYYLDNGEDLKPVRGFAMINEFDTAATPVIFNSLTRPVAYRPLSGLTADMKSINVFPAPVPATVAAVADNIAGTPPFLGIPAKYQPSRRDNFYKGMLMKCWVGTKEVGGRLPYSETVLAGSDNYLAAQGNQKELLPPPESVPRSAFGTQEAAANFASIDSLTSANVEDSAGFVAASATSVEIGNAANTNSYQIGRYYRTAEREIFKVVSFNTAGTTMTVQRGQLGTTAAAIAGGAIATLVPLNEQVALTAAQVALANTFAQADVSRALETRVIQASFRQIDYVPRRTGGCFVSGSSTKKALYASNAASSTIDVQRSATAALRYATAITAAVPSAGGAAHTFVVGQQVILPDGTVRTVTVSATPVFTVDGPPMMAARFEANDEIYSVEPAAPIAAAGCQDEVPGYPAVVRLESPFSRPLDPDTLCYIQRKADVGVYTGMMAMVGNTEYQIKQGAANIYTLAHVATDMKDVNGNPVDRKVPRSYSTESGNLGTNGLRTSAGFFSDGVGLSGQPYTIYSQLELVASQGSRVMSGETITITVPSSAAITAPSSMSALVTPANAKDLISDKVKISHVLLVPLSPACSIVAGYGVASGCQDGNGKGGVFDLILSDKWPYAYTSENGNDINGYAMTVFGGQATVIKTMADKYSQDLPYKPLEGLNVVEDTFVSVGAAATGTLTAETSPVVTILKSPDVPNNYVDGQYYQESTSLEIFKVISGGGTATLTVKRAQLGTVPGAILAAAALNVVVSSSAAALFTDDSILDFKADTLRQTDLNKLGGRAQKNTVVNTARVASGLGGVENANSKIDESLSVARELDLLTLTGGSGRTDRNKMPKLPNSPVTLVHGACGTNDDSVVTTLPYAVCLSLGEGAVAHSQDLGVIDSLTNILTGPCPLLGACTAFKNDWTLATLPGLPAINIAFDGNDIPVSVTLTTGTTENVNVGDELFCMNRATDAAIVYLRVARLGSTASTNTEFGAQKLWPDAVVAATTVNCFKVPNQVVALGTVTSALSHTASVQQSLLETRHLRPGMHVAIVNPTGYVLRAIARIDRVVSETNVTMTQVFPEPAITRGAAGTGAIKAAALAVSGQAVTTLTADPGNSYVDGGYYEDGTSREIVQVVAGGGTTALTVKRAQLGTTRGEIAFAVLNNVQTGVLPVADDMIVALPDGHAAMDALGVVRAGVQAITGKVGQQQTPVTPHALRDLYSKIGSARPVPNYGTVTGSYENPADNLGLGAYIMVGVYSNGTSDRFVHAQQNNKGSTRSALPVGTDMASNLVIQRYIGTSRTTIPLVDVPSGYIGGSTATLSTQGIASFSRPAGQVPRYQARVAGGFAIGRFSYGMDKIMQVRSDMTSGAPGTGTTIPQSTMLPGNVNMDGAVAMSPTGMSVDLSHAGAPIDATPLGKSIAATVVEANSDTDATIAFSATTTARLATFSNGVDVGDYLQVVETGEIVQVAVDNGADIIAIRGALGSRAMPMPQGSTVRKIASPAVDVTVTATTATGIITACAVTSTTCTVQPATNNYQDGGYYKDVTSGEIFKVVAGGGTTTLTLARNQFGTNTANTATDGTAAALLVTVVASNSQSPSGGFADFESSSSTVGGIERSLGRGFATDAGPASLVNNKHPSGHSLDVTAPSTMQKIRFGHSTLPLPQVFHTASHRSGATAQANLLTRGTCGLSGANAAGNNGVLLMPSMNYSATTPTTAQVEMCRTVASSQYNVGLPFSRNAYIEQGMDVYLVSAIFDTLIQRPEPVRKTAIGMTEQGRTQDFPGSGFFAGGSTTLFETEVLAAGGVALTVADQTVIAVYGKQTGAIAPIAAPIAGNIKIGDVVYFAAAATTDPDVIMRGEAMLVTAIDPTIGFGQITVQRAYLGTGFAKIANDAVVFVRRSNGDFPGGITSASAVAPLPEVRSVGQGIHSGGSPIAANKVWQRNDQLMGNIQTTGTRFPRGGPATGAFAAVTTGVQRVGVNGANARAMNFDSAISMETHNYGFDSDFRLYSVLGPFMRPAVIRDVVDTGKISRSVLSSRFPGVQTINAYDSPGDLIDTGARIAAAYALAPALTISTFVLSNDLTAGLLLDESSLFRVGDYITIPTVAVRTGPVNDPLQAKRDAFASGEIMQVVRVATTAGAVLGTLNTATEIEVMRGVLGTVPVGLPSGARIYKIPFEDRNNNGKYSLAPIVGTSFATAQSRFTQYHTYAETDRIVSFCNPLQGDLNNAPGSAIMSAIVDDAVLADQIGAATQHPLEGGKAVFTNPLLMRGWVSTTLTIFNDASAATTAMTASATTVSVGIEAGDLIKVRTAGGVDRGEIMTVASVAAGSANFVVRRGSFGTRRQAMVATDIIWLLKKGEVARVTTQSESGDNAYASSNGNAAAAPSLWTVPRRHHLCRKLITGAPELATADVVVDPYRILNGNNEMYARSRYTESVQMNQVLNQDPSPNMRAMVTFMEPTKIAVSTECASVCEFSAAGFKPSLVNPSCASFTLRSETFSVTFPADFPHLATVSLKETAFASYAEVDADKAAGGIAVSDRKLGVNTYNKGMFLGNFGDISGIPETNAATFTIKQAVNREATLAGIDATARRRLLATCPAGFDARMLRVGSLLKTACDCPTVCGKAESECTTAAGGTWSTINLLERVCKATPSPYDPTGAIVGGVLGGFFGLLLIGLLVWYLCCRKPAPEPVGRAVAIEKPLAPVYLPQPYPMLPEQYVPMPMPVLDATTSIVQPTGQPMLYSSFQGAPIMEAYPAQPGSYPAPYGVAPQVAYGI